MTVDQHVPSDGYSTGMLSKDSPTERERLEAIERNVDSHTTLIFDGLPITSSWNCLELGAGSGSIAYWLTNRCPEGRVVAVDIDTRYLDATRAPNLEIQQVDVADEDYEPAGFDLIHARYLLCHLPTRDAIIARTVGWLNPGGWLVVEDPYLLAADTSPFPLVERVMAAYERKYTEHGADMAWARGLPAVLARNGLIDVAFSGNLGCMGCLGKDRWRPLIRQAAPSLIADGLVTDADLSQFFDLLKDPTFVDIPQVTISAWGRRTPNGLALTSDNHVR